MFLFLFWIKKKKAPPLALPLSSSIFLISFYSVEAVRGEHLHLCTISIQLTKPRLLLLHPAVYTQGHVWSGMGSGVKKGGRKGGKERVWEEEKPGLASYIVSLYIRIKVGEK